LEIPVTFAGNFFRKQETNAWPVNIRVKASSAVVFLENKNIVK